MISQHHIEKIIIAGMLIFHIVFFYLFLYFLSFGDILYYRQIQNKIEFSDLVFTLENQEDYYTYYDYTIILPKFDGYLLNIDVFVDNNHASQNDLLSINWLLDKRPTLLEKESMISINIAHEHGIQIGDYIKIGDIDYRVVDYLPNYHGFNINRGRTGVLLISDFDTTFEDYRNQFMYFNYDYEATFINSYYVRRQTYFEIENKELLITIFITGNILLIGISFYLSSVLKQKIGILNREGYKFNKILKVVLLERFLPNGITLIAFFTLIYFYKAHVTYGYSILSQFLTFILSYTLINLIFSYGFAKTHPIQIKG